LIISAFPCPQVLLPQPVTARIPLFPRAHFFLQHSLAASEVGAVFPASFSFAHEWQGFPVFHVPASHPSTARHCLKTAVTLFLDSGTSVSFAKGLLFRSRYSGPVSITDQMSPPTPIASICHTDFAFVVIPRRVVRALDPLSPSHPLVPRPRSSHSNDNFQLLRLLSR